MSTSTILSVILSVGVLVALAIGGDAEKGCCMPRKLTARASISTDSSQYRDNSIV